MTEYRVLKSVHEESNEGWVWLPDIFNDIETRNFIVIKREGHKPVRCQARIIDNNFYNFYTKREETVNSFDKNNTIIMSYFFRKKLGITDEELGKNGKIDLTIDKVNCFFQKICAFLQHPNDVVKIATILALVSISLAFFSVILSIILKLYY